MALPSSLLLRFRRLPFAALLLWPCLAQAQSAHLSYVETQPVKMGNGTTVGGVAADAAGNLYVLNITSRKVLKHTLNADGSYTSSVIGALPATTSTFAVTVDNGGKVWLGSGNNVWIDVPQINGTYVNNVNSPLDTLSAPITAMAADASGRVYVLSGNDVIRYDPVGANYTRNSVGTFANAKLLAVDANGKVYISNTNTTGSLNILTPQGSGYTPTVVTNAFSMRQASAMTIDGNGLLHYIASQGLYSWQAAGGEQPRGALIADAKGMAMGPRGDIVYSTLGGGGAQAGVLKISATADLGTVPMGATALARAHFIFDQAGPSGTPLVRTLGEGGLDFQFTNSSFTPTVGIGWTQYVNLTFKPLRPGLRSGAIMLNTSGNAAGNTFYLQGRGVGPQAAFLPGAPKTLTSGFTNLKAVVADGDSCYYLADADGHQVLKETRQADGSYVQSTVASGLGLPAALALDGAGNVYIADASANTVVKAALNGDGATYTQSALAIGLNGPAGVAVDSQGNVFISDTNNGQVLKVAQAYNGTLTQTTAISGLSLPGALALDAAGSLYLVETGNHQVLRETPLTGGGYTATTVRTGMAAPVGVAVDGLGSVYIADAQDQKIYVQGPGADNDAPGVTGLAVDASGSIFIASATGARVLDVTQGQLAFPDTLMGQTSAPMTLTVLNNGNADLSFPAHGADTNPFFPASPYAFALDTNLAGLLPVGAGASGPALLAAGATSTLGVTFTPPALGASSGTLTFADTSLNAAPTFDTGGTGQQAITLSGNGVNPTLVLAAAPSSATYGQSVTLTATLSFYTGTVTFMDGATVLGSAPLVNGSAVLTTSSLPAGTHNLTAAFTGDHGVAKFAGKTLSVAQAIPTITWTAPAQPITFGSALDASVLNATAGVCGTFTYTPAAGTVLPLGAQVLTAAFTPTDAANYASATTEITVQVALGAPSVLLSSAGSGQTAPAGSAFPGALVVLVKDSYGNPLPNIPVTFAGTGLSFSPNASISTDANGLASVMATPTEVGTLTASASVSCLGSPVTFSLTGIPGAPTSIAAASGDNQTAVAGTAFTQPLVALVTDAYGNAVPNVAVTFSGSGFAFANGGSATTDANGLASITATPTAAGPLTASASVSGLGTPATFTATGALGAPSSVTAVSGGNQSAVAGSAFAQPLQALVTDSYGLPLPNVAVTFAGSGVSFSPSPTVITGSNGVASVTATPHAAGTLAIAATVSGLGAPATFTETGTLGAPAFVTVVSGANQTAATGSAFPQPLVVRVTDSDGLAMPNVPVTFNGAGLTFANGGNATTGANGQASITATPTASGTLTASASVSGVATPATFTETGTTTTRATRLRIISGSHQKAHLGSYFFQPLVVLVTDSRGLPVRNVAVTFTGTGFSFSPSTTATTNLLGLAGIMAKPKAIGTLKVTASVNGVTQTVVFTEKGIPDRERPSWDSDDDDDCDGHNGHR